MAVRRAILVTPDGRIEPGRPGSELGAGIRDDHDQIRSSAPARSARSSWQQGGGPVGGLSASQRPSAPGDERLVYVAATRAKDRLILTHVWTRAGRDTGGPSRFLLEAGLIDGAGRSLAA
jgi:superfamily I DNA/RNA helicase